MGVRTGNEPGFEDDDVRFRTTYFFRVFDYCQRPGRVADDPNFVKIDSLYRFRMTGKANSLFNDIVFESGTLKAQEIDPLGAKIAYDKDNRSFYFQSRAETERAAACATRDAELRRLQAQYATYADGKLKSDTIKTAIEGRIKALLESQSCAPGSVSSGGGSPTSATAGDRALRAAGDDLVNAAAGFNLKVNNNRGLLGGKKAIVLDLTAPNAADSNKTFANYLDAAGKALSDDPARMADGLDKAAKALEQARKRMNFIGAAVAKGDDGREDLAATAQGHLRAAERGIGEAGAALDKAAKNVLGTGPRLTAAGAELAGAAQAFIALADLLASPQKVLAAPGADAEEKTYTDQAKAQLKPLMQAATTLAAAATRLQAAGRPAGATACPSGEVLRRGFQVLGPEGFRTFDQDDRLIMAMSSKASPLTAQIKELSGRVLAEQTPPGDALLALVRARLKISRTLRELDRDYGEDGKSVQGAEVKDPAADRQGEVDELARKFKGGVTP
jgi:hypothetical protein